MSDFLARHRQRFGNDHRMGQQVRSRGRLDDLPAIRRRAGEVPDLLDQGSL